MNATQNSLDLIIQSALEKYHSMEDPDFSFVQQAAIDNPYKQTIHLIRDCGYDITEDTDPNDDVSFGYLISHEGEKVFLQLSMIAPYAVLQRLLPDDSTELAIDGSTETSIFCQNIMTIIKMQNIQILGSNILLYPISLALVNTAISDVKVYQALFTDRDTIPWIRTSSAVV